MADLAAPIPDFLAKRGITAVSDNVPDGYEVRVPTGHLFQFFGPELMDHLQERRNATDSTSRPGSGS